MLIPELDHDAIIRANREEYESRSDSMKWLGLDDRARAEDARQNLIRIIEQHGSLAFNDTKPHHKSISPGCSLCGRGQWSCLFINNLCNAGCFFCPATQDNQDEPGTSTLTFTEPESYADYLDEFGFKGASISGGEPMLTFSKALSFVKHIKGRFGDSMYLWLYTNGTLADEDKIRMLSDAGLDEIRFNITATGYDLSMAKTASGFIPNVTVEIPAIPEDLETMKAKIGEMVDSGISFLNLHQIRCTQHNCMKLTDRGYTFLHGPQIGVLESELTALALLKHAIEEDAGLGINYCSLIYRHRFQAMSSRKRLAPFMNKPFEDVTDAGMIRMARMDGEPSALHLMEQELISRGCDRSRFSSSMDKTKLWFSAELLGLLNPLPAAVKLSYAIVSVRPGITYRNQFREISLASGRKIAMERATAFMDLELSGPEVELFSDAFVKGIPQVSPDEVYARALAICPSEAAARKWQKIIQAEALRSGLLEYY